MLIPIEKFYKFVIWKKNLNQQVILVSIKTFRSSSDTTFLEGPNVLQEPRTGTSAIEEAFLIVKNPF